MDNKKVKSPYPSQILDAAVGALTVGRGRIKERLFNAYIYQLIHLNNTHFQNYEKKYIEETSDIITQILKHENEINIKDYPNGTAKPIIDLLTEDEACDIVCQIINLANGLNDYLNKN